MNSFKVGSFLLDTKKWVPAGQVFINNEGSVKIQEVEFPPENRFDTEEDANSFFRRQYLNEGLFELDNKKEE